MSEPEGIKAAVLRAARSELARVGPSALSLRSIAREVGLVPSALYRYYAGRDAILSALVRSAYTRLGNHVERADATCPGDDFVGRWVAVWQATRGWALAHPHEYALLYGTPVIGYSAPTDTVYPGTRVLIGLIRIVAEAREAGRLIERDRPAVPAELKADIDTATALLPELGLPEVDAFEPAVGLAVLAAWTTLFGCVSFELFGQYNRSITANAAFVERTARQQADAVGLS